MKMATTGRKLGIKHQDERQGQRSQQPSALKQGRSGDTRMRRRDGAAAQSGIKQSARQRGGLLNINAEQLARGLGFFSLGLGLAEFLAPRAIAKISGIDEKDTGVIRLMGLREMLHGVGIFAQ